jgi:1-acyl-sn-glycerol-3-phosphate acyltransferase
MKTESVFRLLYTVVHPFFTLFHPVKAIGRENIPEGSAVICPNHTTASDPLYIVFAFGKKYPMWAMAKQQVMNWPVVGWILGKAGVFGVERGAADLKAAKTALRCLKENRKLLIFPEGTRVQEGESVDAKAGAALFATRSGAPLLPVYIEPRKKLFRPTTVVIGKPYYPEFSGRKASAEELQVIASDLMDRVRALGEVIK